jgi:4-hydroxybenzoate polyprenyltransferase
MSARVYVWLAVANFIACAVMVWWLNNRWLALVALACAYNAGYQMRAAQAIWATRRAGTPKD